MFTIVGKTTDDKIVVRGVYRFFETHGLPLEIIFDLLKERNMIPDWINLVEEAELAGMKFSRILSKLEDPIADSWGYEFSRVVIKTLEAWNAKRVTKENISNT